MRLRDLSAAVVAAALLSTSTAHAWEPWSDEDPPAPPVRTAFGDYGIRPAAEYRANWLYVRPISVAQKGAENAEWMEHRLRVDFTADYKDKVKIVTSTDVMDGVLWGDNGTWHGDPPSNAGIHVNAKNPNQTTTCVRYRGGDALEPGAYGYGLCPQETWRVRRLYGEVALPFGVLRVGRQPVNIGMGIQNSDGDGRTNRFGFARAGNFVDRILFATKPLEGLKAPAERNLSATEGLFVALGYDRYVTGDPHLFGDDLNQAFWAVRAAYPRWWGGRDLVIAFNHAYRWDRAYSSRIHNLGVRAMSRFGDFGAGFEVVTNQGRTREISQAYALINNDPVVNQKVSSLGARGVFRYDRPTWSVYLEGDYASGDPDPNPGTTLSAFTFAEDTNVGLLLFKHVLALQTARASAAGVELLQRLGATTQPAEAIHTRGAFTNAIAVFPQVDLRPAKNLLLRGGVLMAWAASPVNDPIASIKSRDGASIEDDLVNFAGGKPGRHYGTELDGRVQYRYLEHFIFDLESAILFPGNALQDRDGRAARSFMVQGRTTFFF